MDRLLIALLLALAALALARVTRRTDTVLTGYRIGELKKQESRELQRKSLAVSKLATATTKTKLLAGQRSP